MLQPLFEFMGELKSKIEKGSEGKEMIVVIVLV
jgi:hypothetical protein